MPRSRAWRRHIVSGSAASGIAFALGVGAAMMSPVAEAAPPGSSARDTVAGAASCRVPGDASELIPDGAQFMASADLRRLSNSKLFKDATSAMRSESDVRRTLDGLDACKLGLDDIERITIGGTKNDEFVIILEGQGIGSAALLSCAAKQLAPETKASVFAPMAAGCMSTLDMGKGAGMVLDRRHLVFVSDGWSSKVQARLDGRARSASSGSLAKAMRGANRSAPIWFAADIDEPIDTGSARYDVDGLGGAVDITHGLHVDLAAHFRNPTQAGQLRQELEGYRAIALLTGPSIGVPIDIINGIKLTGNGADLGLSMDLTDQQIAQLQQVAKAQGI